TSDRKRTGRSFIQRVLLLFVTKAGNKVHSFGKREQAIRRNPNVPVIVRGWLHKQDSSGMRLWKRRWFVLADYCLFYYKDSREESVLGSIPLPSYVISPVGPEDRINLWHFFQDVEMDHSFCVHGSNVQCSFGEEGKIPRVTEKITAVLLPGGALVV
uniref:PH domain-containing protein n=1 Tax=Meleagris gallopavo TaxID=9103 RepID=A0A803XLE3_MELGA